MLFLVGPILSQSLKAVLHITVVVVRTLVVVLSFRERSEGEGWLKLRFEWVAPVDTVSDESST